MRGTLVDLDDDRVMADFLLGASDAETRDRILDRLGNDEGYFEAMAALEEDLILRWHQGSLSPSDRALFANAYADPARRARVDEADVLHQAAQVWSRRKTAPSRVWTSPSRRWAALAAAGVVFGLSSWAYLASRQVVPAAPLRVPLSAVSLKAGGNKGYDRVEVPSDASAIVFVVTPAVLPDGGLTAELRARDRAATPLTLRPVRERSAEGDVLTITVDAADLPEGDYVLTVVADANPSEPLATQSVRVIHQRR